MSTGLCGEVVLQSYWDISQVFVELEGQRREVVQGGPVKGGGIMISVGMMLMLIGNDVMLLSGAY